MNEKPLIDPQTLPTWTAAAFIVALLALVFAFVGLYRTSVIALGTQTEVLALEKKIRELVKPQVSPEVSQATEPVQETVE